MSWGERSCIHYGKPCPYSPKASTCNKECQYYKNKAGTKSPLQEFYERQRVKKNE